MFRALIIRRLLAVVAALAVVSCVPHRPYRTYDYADPTAEAPSACAPGTIANLCAARQITMLPGEMAACTSIPELQSPGADGDRHRELVECASEEKHMPLPASDVNLPHRGFDLHVVEFDDEGQVWNQDQVTRTMQVLSDQLAKPAVVVTFVHGWKNNAAVCNGNLSCFREVLGILAKGELAYAGISKTEPRRVIGIYIGWRGASVKTPLKLPDQLTFWGRKHAAHAIGDNGGVTGVIARIRYIVNTAREEHEKDMVPRRTSMVLVGHSFGAALLMSALATSLSADINKGLQQAQLPLAGGAPVREAQALEKQYERSTAQPFVGDREVFVENNKDLVILVNPAMEASRFANIYQASHAKYAEKQIPIFITLASEGDSAVGFFFPVGQSFSTLLRSARSRPAWFSMVEGLGMHRPYHTHRLAPKPGSNAPEPERVSGTCACKSNLGAFGDALVRSLGPFYRAIAAQATESVAAIETKDEVRQRAADAREERLLRMAAYQEYRYSRLEPLKDVDPNNPFITVQVDRSIVGAHGDIFNPRFMDFFIEFVVRTEMKRELVNLKQGATARAAGGR
jgi:hypothetical protein